MIEVVSPVTGFSMRVAEGRAAYWESLGYRKRPRPARKSKTKADVE